jgi:cyclase
MLRGRLVWCLVLLAHACIASGAADNFVVQEIASGIYAVIRRDAPGYAVESNSVFIVGEKDVIVVDAQSNAATTRAVIGALRKITRNPVRYVVNTHWHDDHIVGNQAYREAFPAVEFIGQASSLAYLPGEGRKNRQQFHEGIPDVLAQFRKTLESGRDAKGQPLSAEQLASLRSDVALGEGYLTVPRSFEPILPTLAVHDRLTLQQAVQHGSRTVDIRFLGRGHTSSDLVVHLPAERIVATGDLVVWPIPLVGAVQSHVAEWARSLDRLLQLDAAVFVPGHGPVMREDSYLRSMSGLMRSVEDQVQQALRASTTLEQVRARVDLKEFRRSFAGESKVLDALFSAYVAGPAVESAFNDAKDPARAAPAR